MNDDYNTSTLLDPLDFYKVIMSNLDKYSDKDKFTILRFFDKLSDSSEFSLACKSRMKSHIANKNIKETADKIFNHKSDKVKLLGDIATLDYAGEYWEFSLGGKVVLDKVTNENALKIVKDVNSAFLIMNDRSK